MEIRRIVEYSSFFDGEPPIDVRSVLRQYNRCQLVKMAAILSLHYGNLHYPDPENTLFSDVSLGYVKRLEKLFNAYYRRMGLMQGQLVQLSTFRTALELWRHIFAIPSDEFLSKMPQNDAEFMLLKVLLTLNEKIASIKGDDTVHNLDELLFLNLYLTNDTNCYDYKLMMLTQLHYFYELVEFIPSNDVMQMAMQRLFERWGIDGWDQYLCTILILVHFTNQYKVMRQNGVPIINPIDMQSVDQTGMFAPSLLQHLSIDIDEFIPYNHDDDSTLLENVDYRSFRAKPLVRMSDGNYIVINNELLCERLYNSLYFDFMPLINGRKGSCGFFDYNRDFVEKVLFRNVFFECLPRNVFTFPTRNGKADSESLHQPDFYVRVPHGKLLLVECKAIKMNGMLRDGGDYSTLLDELHEKIVLHTRNLDPKRKAFKGDPEPIGIGQLIYHIDAIEDDRFEWDQNLPDHVIYYPILVFEDVRLLQPGLFSIVNRWFYEELKRHEYLNANDIDCKPVMLLSINTLFMYDELLKRRHLTQVIDIFLQKYACYDTKTGEYRFSREDVCFDAYLRQNSFNKSARAAQWMKQIMSIRHIEKFIKL